MVKLTTLIVDFPGSREEARQFAKEHPDLHLAHKPGPAGGGLPQLTARAAGPGKRAKLLALLDSLGWPEEAIEERTHTCGPY